MGSSAASVFYRIRVLFRQKYQFGNGTLQWFSLQNRLLQTNDRFLEFLIPLRLREQLAIPAILLLRRREKFPVLRHRLHETPAKIPRFPALAAVSHLPPIPAVFFAPIEPSIPRGFPSLFPAKPKRRLPAILLRIPAATNGTVASIIPAGIRLPPFPPFPR